jgi:hypothetical protein
MRKLLFAIAVALALPGAARAGLVTMTARDVPLGPRALAAVSAPGRFDMLGVHWQGSGSVEYRVRSTAGRWGPWLAADDDSGPDLGSSERQRGWRDGGVDWVGAANDVRFRTAGTVTRLRAYYLWSKVTTSPRRTLSLVGSPSIVPRSAWLADEKIVRAAPRYAPSLRLAIVHHTAGTNSYTPAQAAAIVRGIEIYHVQANGWNDIGYNLLIDRYGTVYEGRGGGVTRNVIGAHALGFNSGTVGIALIGDFQDVAPPAAMQTALENVLAWRLDIAHVDPLSDVVYTSAGNAKYPAGKVVTLPAISGHRDTGPTECPGNDAYALLPEIRQRVSRIGLPKLYSPVVSGSLASTVRFQGRLSSPRAWTVTVTNAAGVLVARGHGVGATIDWTWKSSRAGPGPFSWSIASGAAVRTATGRLGSASLLRPPVTKTPAPTPAPAAAPQPTPILKPVTPPVAPTPVPAVGLLSALSAAPAVVSPAADGSGGYVTVNFTLSATASVTARLTGGATPLTLLSATVPAGASTFSWNLGAVPDGHYQIAVTATLPTGASMTDSIPVTVDRSVVGYAVGPSLFSPNGDGLNDSTTVGFTLAQQVPVQILVERLGAVVATVFTGLLGPGPQAISWNGLGANGVRVPDGGYDVVTIVTTAAGTSTYSAPVVLDATPPTLTLIDPTTLRFQLSEPALITATVNGQLVSGPEPAGVFTLPLPGAPITSISVQATDAAGNKSAVVTYP